jgi:DNA replication and repair protein RecF
VRIRSLSLQNVRCLRDVGLDALGNTIILSGANGAGKTSVLEGIHLLGMGRSFRTRSSRELLRQGENFFQVVGRILDDPALNGSEHVVGFERNGSACRIRTDGSDVARVSDLARILPLLVIRPESHELISGGSEERRRILDWAVFHVEPSYAAAHATYRRALAQRNRALREGATEREVTAWDHDVATSANILQSAREGFFTASKHRLQRTIQALVGLDIEVLLRPGWDQEEPLSAQLRKKLTIDRQRGFTSIGPHRADLIFQMVGRRARSVLSRGESKLLVLGALLSLANELATSTERKPVILVDDLASELDAAARARFFKALGEIACQSFITTVDADLIPPSVQSNADMFHVERGQIQRVL